MYTKMLSDWNDKHTFFLEWLILDINHIWMSAMWSWQTLKVVAFKNLWKHWLFMDADIIWEKLNPVFQNSISNLLSILKKLLPLSQLQQWEMLTMESILILLCLRCNIMIHILYIIKIFLLWKQTQRCFSEFLSHL